MTTESAGAFRPPRLTQVAMASNNIPRSIQLYTTVFGFVDGRGEALWSKHLAKLQEVGDEVSTWIWWMVGRQDFLQLELFQHSIPQQRPLPEDWKPSDHGWVRWGMAVPEFDDCLARLTAFGATPVNGPAEFGDGVRRFAFRDPCVGTWVEVLEDGPALRDLGDPQAYYDIGPRIVYAAVSVPDLEVAREFWNGTMGLPPVDLDQLHPTGAESLWGLEAPAGGFCADAGSALIEVVHYEHGRPKPDGYLLSDQGLINVAVGYRSHEQLNALLARLDTAGCELTAEISKPPSPGAGYTHAPDGTSVELVAIPREFDLPLGWAPRIDNDLKQRLHGSD